MAADGDKDGQAQTVQYQKLTPMLLNEVQRQHRKLQEQREQNRNQDEQIQSLQAQVAALRKTVDALLSSKASSTAAAGQ